MVNNSGNKNSRPRCSQCGSELIFVSKETVQPEGSRYAQINTIYRCSNDDCQKKKDKDKADRLKIRLTKELMEKERTEKIQELRQLGRKVKTQAN
jgi:hypothetical protein